MYGNTCTDREGREWGDGREREDRKLATPLSHG